MINDGISFTSKVKEEQCGLEYNQERLKALLAAYIRINGSLTFKNKRSFIILKSENAKIVSFIFGLFKELYDISPNIKYVKQNRFKNSLIYEIEVVDEDEHILKDLDISFLDGKISKDIVFDDNTIAGYLGGVFLASGCVNSPASSSYHLEISLSNENHAKWVSHLFARYKNSLFEPKIIKRRSSYVLYLKKSDRIGEFLVLIGAINCCMEFESYRIDRDFNNNTNRLYNLDTANMEKTVLTSNKQVLQIKTLASKIGLANLEDKRFLTLCELRLNNESASLNELSVLLSQKLGQKVTKASVVSMFKKLDRIYDKLKDTKDLT